MLVRLAELDARGHRSPEREWFIYNVHRYGSREGRGERFHQWLKQSLKAAEGMRSRC